jgi:NodT family efflux transporter outer membrane factor (OMF) lipoprotein
MAFLRRSTVPMMVAMSLVGCAVGPDFVQPSPPPVNGYTAGKLSATESAPVSGGSSQHFVRGEDVSGAWWRLFKSKQIDALVEEAVANHPDIAAAQQALRQARETEAADVGSLFPSITSSGGVTRERVSPAQQGVGGKGYDFTLYNTSVPVSYTPDIWGGKARGIEADAASADYQQFQLEATYMTLTANVVTAAINDANYAAQIRVTKELIDGQQKQVDLLDQQFKLGAVSEADVLQQKSQLAASLATLPPLEKARAQGRNQLMAYLGRFPSQDKGESVSLDGLTLPRDLPLSVPSVLVRQRPDIRAAEAQVHQAGANVGVATANMLPQLTLSASGGGDALQFNKLFQASSSVWSIGASVTTPIFDAGALFHTKEARVATFEQAKDKYKSTVITAFQNVADALRAIQADAALLKAQLASENTAAASLKISQAQFQAGAGTFLNVLNAEQTLLNARTSRVKAEAGRYADTVALFQALGGGWWNRVDVTEMADVKSPGIAIVSEPLGALSNLHDAK